MKGLIKRKNWLCSEVARAILAISVSYFFFKIDIRHKSFHFNQQKKYKLRYEIREQQRT